MLHPDARALIDLIDKRGLPAMNTLTPVDARAFYRDRREFTQPAAPDVGAVRDASCDGPHGPIALRIYRPLGAGAAPTPGTTLPVLVYYHGGGWTIGDLDTHDVLCRELCNGAGVVVVVGRLPNRPRAPFPGRRRRLPGGDALGRRAMRASSASTRRGWRSAATAPAATSPPSSRSSRAIRASCRSLSSC